MDLFRTNCISECYISKAQHQCGCIPWDYPPINKNDSYGKSHRLCGFYGNSCFNSFLKNGLGNECKTQCNSSCNEVKYTMSVEKEPLDGEKICSYDDEYSDSELSIMELAARKHIRNGTYSAREAVIRFQEALTKSNGRTEFLYKYCQNKVKYDMALVDIIMDSPTVLKYVQNVKVTFTDKLANLGKQFLTCIETKIQLNIYSHI